MHRSSNSQNCRTSNSSRTRKAKAFKNPLLPSDVRSALIEDIRSAAFVWDKRHPDYLDQAKKDNFFHQMDERYYPDGEGSSSQFYKTGRSNFSKALNSKHASEKSGNPGVGMTPAWVRDVEEWSFLKDQIGTVTVRDGQVLSQRREESIAAKAQVKSSRNCTKTQPTKKEDIDTFQAEILSKQSEISNTVQNLACTSELEDDIYFYGKLVESNIRKFPSKLRPSVFQAVYAKIIDLAQAKNVDIGINSSVETQPYLPLQPPRVFQQHQAPQQVIRQQQPPQQVLHSQHNRPQQVLHNRQQPQQVLHNLQQPQQVLQNLQQPQQVFQQQQAPQQVIQQQQSSQQVLHSRHNPPQQVLHNLQQPQQVFHQHQAPQQVIQHQMSPTPNITGDYFNSLATEFEVHNSTDNNGNKEYIIREKNSVSKLKSNVLQTSNTIPISYNSTTSTSNCPPHEIDLTQERSLTENEVNSTHNKSRKCTSTSAKVKEKQDSSDVDSDVEIDYDLFRPNNKKRSKRNAQSAKTKVTGNKKRTAQKKPTAKKNSTP